MDVTLLGSGEALGVPAPLCDCEYCTESEPRRRPGLLVEGEDATVVLDAGPDLRHQLAAVGQPDVDAFLVTHHHFDHVAGLKELNHAAMPYAEHMLNDEELPDDDRPAEPDFEVYLTPTAQVHASYRAQGTYERLAPGTLEHGEPVAVGDLTVTPFPVDHARPAFDTVGFAVHEGSPDGDPAVVYAPDMWGFLPEETAGRAYEGADLLFAEGSALLGVEGHGPREDLVAALAGAGADRTVLVDASEHLARAHTDELAARASEHGYELGADLARYEV
jgi:phosphoribosyl 1,2-cyclic phosphate phosphodiesterase